MTVTQIQTIVASRLNLTSAIALSRIIDSINERYKQVASSIGMETTAPDKATATTSIGNELLTFGPTPKSVIKIRSVYNAAFTPPMVLDEVTVDTLRNQPKGTDPPAQYAIYATDADNVTIMLGSAPATAFDLTADVEVNVLTLTGSGTPKIPAAFHDIFTYWAMGVELDHMEKYDMAAKQEKLSENRLSDLRFFVAKSNYKDIFQGKNAGTSLPVQLV